MYQRPRPAVVLHLMPASYSSFPSGHSMMSAVVYLTLGALSPAWSPSAGSSSTSFRWRCS